MRWADALGDLGVWGACGLRRGDEDEDGGWALVFAFAFALVLLGRHIDIDIGVDVDVDVGMDVRTHRHARPTRDALMLSMRNYIVPMQEYNCCCKSVRVIVVGDGEISEFEPRPPDVIAYRPDGIIRG